MGVHRRAYVELLLSRRAHAKTLSERIEIVTEIGDDIRIYLDVSITRILHNRLWAG